VQTLKRSLLFLLGTVQIFILLAAMAKPARAYVDPGSGLLFFQMGGSMLAGALFVMRARIRKLLGLKPKTRPAPLETAEESEIESTFRTGTHG
jgi:hypothetical protein